MIEAHPEGRFFDNLFGIRLKVWWHIPLTSVRDETKK
jgi:hypothetical protein